MRTQRIGAPEKGGVDVFRDSRRLGASAEHVMEWTAAKGNGGLAGHWHCTESVVPWWEAALRSHGSLDGGM